VSSLRNLIGNRNPLRLLWHHSKAFLAALLYGFPARHLTIISITGTDGKTTTVGMVAHILNKAGLTCGALSTAFMRIGNRTDWNETQKTSPSPFILQRFLRQCVNEDCTDVVLECSSHGLVQGRLNCTWPTVAAITNTSMEHLDYHGTMEQYRKDKAKIFSLLRGGGTKVLNSDDETFVEYDAIPSSRTITYTSHSIDDETFSVPLQIPGTFNQANAHCAIACAEAVGVPRDVASEALRSFTGVPGRMEEIDEGQEFSVYVDMTVTPVAYEQTLSTLRAMLPPEGRLLVLTGSCGDRMREKRPIVAKICSALADVVVVANEDPYTEDPEKIIDEVWSGIDETQCDAHRIADRRKAIEFLFALATPGDIVILCAKGSDTTMWVKKGQIPWNERSIARELLRELQTSSGRSESRQHEKKAALEGKEKTRATVARRN